MRVLCSHSTQVKVEREKYRHMRITRENSDLALVEFDTRSYLCQVYKNLHEETQLPIVTHENNDDQKMLCFK